MIASIKKAVNYHLIVMLSLAVFAGTVSMISSGMMGKKVTDHDYLDLWFDADLPWVFDNMSNIDSIHRTKRHPVFSLITLPVVKALSIAGLTDLLAVRTVLAIIAALWIVTLYTILRIITPSWFDALSFSALAIASSSFLFWASVPETWLLGSLTILLAILLVAAKDKIKHTQTASLLVSILTLGITITNWMAGIVATFSINDRRKGIRISLVAFCIILTLSVIQKNLLRTDGLLLKQDFSLAYVASPVGEVSDKCRTFFWHSIIMPDINIIKFAHPDGAVMDTMSVQKALAGTGTFVGTLAVIIWNLLLALGVYGLFSSKSCMVLKICIGAILVGQMFLHSVIRTEVFVYAVHYSTLLVFLSSWSTATRWRPFVLVLTWVLVVLASINNWTLFLVASEMYKGFPG